MVNVTIGGNRSQRPEREPLKDGERGLVISAGIKASPTAFSLGGSNDDPQMLRLGLLLFDRLDLPDYDVFAIESSDFDYLESSGVMQRTRATIGQFTEKSIHKVNDARLNVYRKNESRSPGQWSMAGEENFTDFPKENSIPGQGAIVSILRALPIPDKDAPLEDVLAFKDRRHPELLALRHHLDGIYLRVAMAGDNPLVLQSEITGLQAALANFVRSGAESRIKFHLSDFRANLNIAAAGRAIGAALVMGLDPVSSTVSGMAGALKINIGGGLKGGSLTGTPFEYIAHAHREL